MPPQSNVDARAPRCLPRSEPAYQGVIPVPVSPARCPSVYPTEPPLRVSPSPCWT
eukprot:SAG25_NODE_633_length_6301_cov_5.477427_4_plen_55_part_00